jgi:hypothetical protein
MSELQRYLVMSQLDRFPLMMLTVQIKKENKFNLKEVFVSALKSLIQIIIL